MSEYANAWRRLVAENGLEGARAIMKERRKLVVNHPGGIFRDPAVAKENSLKAVVARKKKNGLGDGPQG